MNKAKIEKMARNARAKSAQAKPTQSARVAQIASDAPDAPEAAQGREARGAVNLTPETIDAIVGGFSRELRRALLELGPILARLAAADTVHTVERAPRVFGRALDEAQAAQAALADAGVAE